MPSSPDTENPPAISPWLTPREAAARAKVGKNFVYHEPVSPANAITYG